MRNAVYQFIKNETQEEEDNAPAIHGTGLAQSVTEKKTNGAPHQDVPHNLSMTNSQMIHAE